MLKISIEAEAKEIAELVLQLQKKSGNEKATKERSGYLEPSYSPSAELGHSTIAMGLYSSDSSTHTC